MDTHKTWFSVFRNNKTYAFLQKRPIAYFCIEYALSDLLPTYAGGLGVLAGDYVKELYDQKIPAVAVGLYYQSKYGALDIAYHSDTKHFLAPDPIEQGLLPVLDSNKKPVLVKIPYQDHYIFVKAWIWNKNTIPVYLLDTNVDENTVEDRRINFELYDSNKETRIKQEMVLGIGGYRLLQALTIQPSVYHMNEGHSALLYLELIRHEMQKHTVGFHDAVPHSRHHIVFTNHTLLPAGNEIFGNDLFTYSLERYASELEVPVSEIASLGMIHEMNSFSMSLFALRFAGKINAVSKLHAKEAIKLWVDYPIEAVTNGIHIPSWDVMKQNENKSLEETRKEQKQKLLSYLTKQSGVHWGEDALLLGWARRMVRYKRPMALFSDLQRFQHLARNENKPVRIVMAGIAHQGDKEGREFMQQIQQLFKNALSDVAVYLTEYNTTIAKMLTSGCDVWLNTPVVGSEACGTSSMKACLNGTLVCTTKDGWIAEVEASDIGWQVDTDTIQVSLLDILEKEIIPTYYSKDKNNWNNITSKSRKLIIDQFSTTRMLRDYFEKLYLPILSTAYSEEIS